MEVSSPCLAGSFCHTQLMTLEVALLVIAVFQPVNGDESIQDLEDAHITSTGPNILKSATSIYRGGWEI